MRLYGKNPASERLKSNPKSIRKIYLQEGFDDAAYFHKKARQWAIPVIVIPKSKMIKIARNINTQGILLDVDDFSYVPFDDLLEQSRKKRKTLLFLDEVNDPQNLGAILRSAACLGPFSIVLPTHDSVSVTEAVLRVASGGDNFVAVSRVANLGQAIKSAREAGYFIAGAVVKGGQRLGEVSLPYPLGLVVGSEQKGIRDVILKHLDLQVTIPMASDRLSLNVAHAVSILCYEVVRQRGEHEKEKNS